MRTINIGTASTTGAVPIAFNHREDRPMTKKAKKTKPDHSMKTGRGSDTFMLRLPDGVREQVAIVAENTNRSMNACFVEAIVAWLGTPHPNASLADVATFAEKLAIRIGAVEARLHALDGKGEG